MSLAANTTIGHHLELERCPAWAGYLQPLIVGMRDTAQTTALEGADPVLREEARIAYNTLKALLKRLDTDFQSALRDLNTTGQLPPYLAQRLQVDPQAQPAQAIPDIGADPSLNMDNLMAKLVAQLPSAPGVSASTPAST